MRRVRIALVVSFMVVSAFALRAALWGPYALVGNAPVDGFVRVSGVVHVHTTISDGGAAPEEMIAAARAAGARFVVITDHNSVDAKPFEGYHDGVLALVGSELSTNAGHLLALGIPDPQFRFSGDVRDGLADVRDLGGIAFAAHPWSPRKDFQWTGWDLPGPWGIEIMNLDSGWRRAGWPSLAWGAMAYGLNHQYALLSALGAGSEDLAEWDALLAMRDVPGIVGTDAHGRVAITKTWSAHYPSYASLFAFAQNHVLLASPLSGNAASDAAVVLRALRRGASYAAVDALAPADGFSFTVESHGRRFTMGDTVPAALGGRLRAGGRMPPGVKLTLLRDGRVLQEREGTIDVPIPGAGVYRVEARIPGWTLPWILSNPIYVYDEAAQWARQARAAWPVDVEPPPLTQVIDTFEGRTVFQAGCDPSSTLAPGVLDATGGADGHGAARMQFRLGVAGSERRDISCEFLNRDRRDFSGRTGFGLSIKGDGVYRIWVQVRDDNPASTDDGTEWWFASVRTSNAWRRVRIPFTAFRSMDPKTDGSLDLRHVRAVGFILDRGAVKLGTSGTIWIDDVGVY